MAQRLDRGPHPRHVAVVIGAQRIDHPLGAPLELVAVVGDVGGEVGRLAVGADQHPILVVAELARPQPDRALAVVDVAAPAQLRRSPPRSCRPRAASAPRTRCRSGPRSAPGSPRSVRASPRCRAGRGPRGRPGRLRRRQARRPAPPRTRLGTRPRAARRPACAPRSTPRSARTWPPTSFSRYSRSTWWPASSSSRASESPYAAPRPAATVSGPVGLADTNSTSTRSGRSGVPRPKASPASSRAARLCAVPAIGEEEVHESRARDLDSLGAVGQAGRPAPRAAARRSRAAPARAPARAASRRWWSSRPARAWAGARASARSESAAPSPQGVRRRADRGAQLVERIGHAAILEVPLVRLARCGGRYRAARRGTMRPAVGYRAPRS